MAASFARAAMAMVMLALCFVAMCQTVSAGPQHTCTYPQACTNPGAPDPNHIVTATAQYNPTTNQCESITPVTGPHDCQKFATLAACNRNCASA